jgi:apolipoprotein N-acyltransferase
MEFSAIKTNGFSTLKNLKPIMVLALPAALAGVLTSLAFPNPWFRAGTPGGGVMAWFSLAPFFWALLSAQKKFAIPLALFFGLPFYGIHIFWLATTRAMMPFAPLAWFLLCLFLCLTPLVVSLGIRWLEPSRLWERAAALPLLWVLGEYLRLFLFSGFPWGYIGYSQIGMPGWSTLAAITGIWGHGFVVAAMNAGWAILLVFILKHARQKINNSHLPVITISWKRWILASIFLIVLGSCLLVGYVKLKLRPAGNAPPLMAGILQGNIDQDQEWNRTYQEKTLRTYGVLIQEAVATGAQLVVWPETAFPGIFSLDAPLAESVRNFSKNLTLAQIVGSDEVRPKSNGKFSYYNSALALDHQGVVIAETSKRHLVPFGEYVPFKNTLLPFVEKVVGRYIGEGFSPGPSPNLFRFAKPSAAIGVLICYESIFPQYARNWVEQGANLLAVITYDTWYGKSAMAAQHANFAAFRAAETRRYLLRAAAGGISVLYDPFGRALDSMAYGQTGQITRPVHPRTELTPYVEWGDWFVFWALLACAALYLDAGKKKFETIKKKFGKKA